MLNGSLMDANFRCTRPGLGQFGSPLCRRAGEQHARPIKTRMQHAKGRSARQPPAAHGRVPIRQSPEHHHKGSVMARKEIAKRASIPAVAFVVWGCVSQAAYNEQSAQLEEARAQATAQQAQIAKMQAENKWVMAGDLLFPGCRCPARRCRTNPARNCGGETRADRRSAGGSSAPARRTGCRPLAETMTAARIVFSSSQSQRGPSSSAYSRQPLRRPGVARRTGCSALPPTGSGHRRGSRREITARAACTRDANCQAP
jgi:hypothetical protein